jgi:hypothetical protein
MDKKLPNIRFRQAEPADREALAKWLDEWNLRQALAEGEDTPALSDTERGSFPEALPYDAEPSVGDIRLLDIDIPIGQSLPLVLVLARWPEESATRYVVAFFSPVSCPAMRSEFSTEKDPPLATLSLWNSCLLPGDFLAQSWKLGILVDHLREKALEVYKSWALDETIPASLISQVGPPLVHPMDPRHEYVELESQRMQVVKAAYSEWEQQPLIDNVIDFPLYANEEKALLAAKDYHFERGLLTKRFCLAEDAAIILSVSEGIEKGMVAIEVVSDAGDYLESAAIRDSEDKLLGEILSGQAYLRLPSDAKLYFSTRSGAPLSFKEVSSD